MNYLLTSVMAMALLALVSCKDDDDEKLPTIDGYNNSNEVASDNLVAHWTFDDTENERLSSTAPEDEFGTVGFTDGQIGKALQLDSGALVYPSISSIGEANSLGNYTVSMWVNVKNNGSYFTTLFAIIPTETTEPWGNLSLSAETGQFPADGPVGDTLVLKTNYSSKNEDGSINNQDNRPDPKGVPPVGVLEASGEWTHYVVRFTASTHMLEIFGNGTSIGAYNNRGDNTVELNMRTPAQAVFGSLASQAIGFESAPLDAGLQAWATGSVDDVRVYNTALANNEITALYNLGTAGR